VLSAGTIDTPLRIAMSRNCWSSGAWSSIARPRCRHRRVQYLNNILEQDQRAIKKRIRAEQQFRRFGCARRTNQGYETTHKIREGQVRWVKKGDVRAQNQFIDRVFGLPA
jgi:transposase-like protein